jgi:hypothetical protein
METVVSILIGIPLFFLVAWVGLRVLALLFGLCALPRMLLYQLRGKPWDYAAEKASGMDWALVILLFILSMPLIGWLIQK